MSSRNLTSVQSLHSLLLLNIATSQFVHLRRKETLFDIVKLGSENLKNVFSHQGRVIYISQAFDLILTAISLSLAFSLTEALLVS